MNGVTLDTGALIALERRSKRMQLVIKSACDRFAVVTVPAVVVIEWWRGGSGQHEILRGLRVEPTTELIAKAAGLALRTLDVSPTDAAVMASAALRGDIVYTSDLEDLTRLRTHFPGVPVLRA